LIYHKINKIKAGYFNTALITDKGDLLIQGMNNFAQLTLPQEIQQKLNFFSEFMKIDALNDYYVRDVSISQATIHTICEHKYTSKIKLFGWGFNLFG
jgi:alpha-tubulin suppressor-like RCC1 family protein